MFRFALAFVVSVLIALGAYGAPPQTPKPSQAPPVKSGGCICEDGKCDCNINPARKGTCGCDMHLPPADGSGVLVAPKRQLFKFQEFDRRGHLLREWHEFRDVVPAQPPVAQPGFELNPLTRPYYAGPVCLPGKA